MNTKMMLAAMIVTAADAIQNDNWPTEKRVFRHGSHTPKKGKATKQRQKKSKKKH